MTEERRLPHKKELGEVVEVSLMWQCVRLSSGRAVWIEKRYSVPDAAPGDTLVITLKSCHWVKRWYGERV